MKKMLILVTSPSLNASDNVSGIANLTKLWIENNNEAKYIVFEAGKKDRTRRSLLWILKQPIILFSFLKTLLKNKEKIDYVHINMPLEKLAILRDACFAFIVRLTDKPLIVHLRGGAYSTNDNAPIYYQHLIKKVLQEATRVIVLGKHEKNYYVTNYGIAPDKINVMPNCVNVPQYAEKVFKVSQNLNILFLGRLDKNKGLNEIIDSLTALIGKVDYSFEVAGDGPDKVWFVRSCKDKLREKFKYCGVVSGMAKHELLRSSHIFLLPSYYEGLPNALLEAMSYGIVPIVTPVGSIPEVVANLENGIIVSVKNKNSISDAIIRIAADENLYKKLSNNAYSETLNNYSLNNYITKLNDIYAKAISINNCAM